LEAGEAESAVVVAHVSADVCLVIDHYEKILQLTFYSYTEAAPILYERNLFDFRSVDQLIQFPKSLLPQRLKSIRSVELHWTFSDAPYAPWDRKTWIEACDALAAMTGLRDLKIELRDDQSPFTGLLNFTRDDVEQGGFEKVQPRSWALQVLSDRGINVDGTFEVRVAWPAEERENLGEKELPFRITRV